MVFYRHRHVAQIFYKTWIYDFDFQTLGFARVAWLFSNWSWWLFSKKSWWLSTCWQIQSGTRGANPRMPARCDALDILLNTKRDTQMKIDRLSSPVIHPDVLLGSFGRLIDPVLDSSKYSTGSVSSA